MRFLQYVLYPASLLYQGIAAARNKLYEANLLSRRRFQVPVLVVGNLAVGGTGKTPHTEYLIRLLKAHKRLAVLSRGYKRSTKGFILAGPADTAATIGDEPMLYHTQFPEIKVTVGEKRPEAIAELLKLNPAPEVIILDDAFQHRPLQASFYLLLTDFAKPFYRDLVLPAGRLRESASGAARANAVVVTKCPDSLSEEKRSEITQKIQQYTLPGTPVFFSAYRYGQPVCLTSTAAKMPEKLILLTAIANPVPFAAALKKQGHTLVQEVNYPDHYAYKPADMQKLRKLAASFAGQEIAVVTTSKDAMKLQQPELLAILAGLPVFFVPVQVQLLNGRQFEFDELLLSAAGIEKAAS